MPEDKKKYVCMYVLRGMYRMTVGADSLQELFDLLQMKDVVFGEKDGLTDAEILEKIYKDSEQTTGRLTIYKLNEEYDPDDPDEFDDEYIICKHGVV